MSSSIGQTPTFLLTTTCDEILSWLITIWMENNLEGDNYYNTLNLPPPPPNFFYKE